MDGMTVLLHPLGAWRSGMTQAEIYRPKAGSGWRIHNLTDASWRRLMYVTRNEPWKPNCARLVGEPSRGSQTAPGSLVSQEALQGPGRYAAMCRARN